MTADAKTEQDIIKLENEWIEAIAQRDAAMLDRLLAEGFTIAGWLPNGRIASRSVYLADCLKPVEVKDASYSFAQWQIQDYGQVAVVNCLFESHAIVFGQTWGGQFLLTDVWLKQAGEWRAVTRHSSPVVVAKDE